MVIFNGKMHVFPSLSLTQAGRTELLSGNLNGLNNALSEPTGVV